MSYSLDLRKRTLAAVREEKMTQVEAAKRFKVSVSSLKRWLLRGCLQADKPGPQASRLDVEALKKVVKEKPDAYLDEYARMLNTSSSTVSYNLLKLGIGRKKNDVVRGAKRRKTQDIPAGD